MPVVTEPCRDGTVRVFALPAVEVPADAGVQAIAQRCWEVFEPCVRAQPGLYLWAYKHFRYRPRDAAREYPAYAHESGAFEKLRRAGPVPRRK